jgi:membrane-associated phospholipid phosphatase
MAFAARTVIGAAWQNAQWLACGAAVGVAVSRTTLLHSLSDVVAGAFLGLLVGRRVTSWGAKGGFLELDSDPRAAPTSDS